MADQKVLAELEAQLRAGRVETNRQRRLNAGLEMLNAHHDAASANWSDGELAYFARIYFEDHRDRYPSLDEVACNSSSEPEEYVGEQVAWLMRQAANLAGRSYPYSTCLNMLERQAARWLNDVFVKRQDHGARAHYTGPMTTFPGTKVDGPDET